MYLIYTDETGTSFDKNLSPFLLYGGLLVHESKVNLLELQLQSMIGKFLGLEDVKRVELHTSEIFHILFSENFDCEKKRNSNKKKHCKELTKTLEKKSKEDFIQFSDELIQFLIKMNVPLLVSIVKKDDEIHKKHPLGEEISALAYSFKMFLNILDRFLASHNENGLLIADDFHNQIPTKIRKLPLHERISNKNLKSHKELVYLRVLHRSLDWKTNHIDLEELAPLKYEFESKNMFLIDNINYTNSKDSILNQVADFMLFIIRKTLEYDDKYPDNIDDNLLKVGDLIKTVKKSIRLAENTNTIQTGTLSEDDIMLGTSIIKNIVHKEIWGEMEKT